MQLDDKLEPPPAPQNAALGGCRFGPPTTDLAEMSRDDLIEQVCTYREAFGVHRLLVVSDHIPNPELLHDAANDTTRTVRVCYKRDSLKSLLIKMTKAAGPSAGRLSSVGFMDHAEPNQFRLLEGLDVGVDQVKHNEELREFFRGVAALLLPKPAATNGMILRTVSGHSDAGEMGRIDLLGCNLAQDGGADNALVKEMEQLTGYTRHIHRLSLTVQQVQRVCKYRSDWLRGERRKLGSRDGGSILPSESQIVLTSFDTDCVDII